VQKDGETFAVKLLCSTMPDDDQFKRELWSLANVCHPNIVRLFGFCHETRQEMVQHNGNFVLADKIRMALCLEYMCNGSLAKYLSGNSSDLLVLVNYQNNESFLTYV
jgi:serine/threonine protein kinase